jgi:RING finger and CHY zinc finger domain-containing protein 1
MSDDESPYHCSACGFCRVGGRENFRHCDDCGMCIDTLLFDDHNCKAGKYMSNCPVCQEDLFSSRDASHEMPCGHAIHWHCFKELTSYDTRCPVCKKTAETPEHMAPTWQAMAMGIALQPVPPELARVVTIMCNDCEQRDGDRRWHFLGVRCLKCMSFNTTIEMTTLSGREAASYLDDLDLARGGPAEAAISMNGGDDDDDPMDAEGS